MKLALCSLLVVAACDSGPTHWKKQPLETYEGTHDGMAFTIQMPKGMKQSGVDSKYSVEWGYSQQVDGEGYTFAPSISVSKAAKKKTLDEAIAEESSVKAPTDVLHKEETATGWVFAIKNDAYKDKEDYLVYGQTFVGDAALKCNARVYPMKKGDGAKGDIPLVAKMCQSLKAK